MATFIEGHEQVSIKVGATQVNFTGGSHLFASDERFELQITLKNTNPNDVKAQMINADEVQIEGKSEATIEGIAFVRCFNRKIKLPKRYDPTTVKCRLNTEGVLLVTGCRAASKVTAIPVGLSGSGGGTVVDTEADAGGVTISLPSSDAPTQKSVPLLAPILMSTPKQEVIADVTPPLPSKPPPILMPPSPNPDRQAPLTPPIRHGPEPIGNPVEHAIKAGLIATGQVQPPAPPPEPQPLPPLTAPPPHIAVVPGGTPQQQSAPKPADAPAPAPPSGPVAPPPIAVVPQPPVAPMIAVVPDVPPQQQAAPQPQAPQAPPPVTQEAPPAAAPADQQKKNNKEKKKKK